MLKLSSSNPLRIMRAQFGPQHPKCNTQVLCTANSFFPDQTRFSQTKLFFPDQTLFPRPNSFFPDQTPDLGSSDRSLLQGDNDRNRAQITSLITIKHSRTPKTTPSTQTTIPPTSIQMDNNTIHRTNTIHQRLGSTNRRPQIHDIKCKSYPLVTPLG